jgi:glycosyltransferase involved in cell wall biosynthesis
VRTTRLTADPQQQPQGRPRPRVLVVGQPSAGGIGTFIHQILEDGWLGERVSVEFLPTPLPDDTRPGSLSWANVRQSMGHTLSLFRRARRADIVHLNMAGAPLLPLMRAFVFSLAARAAGARVILHMHTGWVEPALDDTRYRRLFRVVARLVDVVVAVSAPTERAIGTIAPRVRRIGNGIDASRFRPERRDERPTLLYVGTVCERKGLIDLRDALESMAWDGKLPFRVVIAGDGKQAGPGAFDKVRDAFESSGLRDVEFLGEVGPEQVAELLERATIFCLPSHWEGFPLAILEAMASGTPVVATAVGDVPLMLEGGRAGALVEPQDPDALAEAIGKLIANPDRCDELARRARERVESEFTHRAVMRELLDVYAETAGRATAAA